MRAVCLGVHVVDTLARPVTEIPAGQGGTLVEEIRLTPAGTAGGTAVVLSKLGASVLSAGAIGTDALGDALLAMLTGYGVDVSGLVRRTDVQTSASVLPIRPDGSRPALHVIGANGTYGPADAPWDEIAACDFLHLGAPEFMGGAAAAEIAAFARARGVVVSADLLAPGEQAAGVLEWIAPLFAELDLLLPNAEQVLGLTGASTLEDGCVALCERGIGCVAATDGGDGAVVCAAGSKPVRVSAYPVEVVDTTGCGDAFSAGFLIGRWLGSSEIDAARLGCAVAGLVAGGLGSDFGAFGLADAQAIVATG